MKKLFILGIGGLVGSKLAKVASEEYSILGSYNFRNPKFNSFKTFQIDVNNFQELSRILKSTKPNYIVNSVALTNVDLCETCKEKAKKINLEFVQKLEKISKLIDAKLIHISTDSIFDGEKDYPYVENDIPNPQNYYGEIKLQSEKSVLQNKKNLVIRASILYGWMPKYLVEIKSSSLKSTNFVQWLIKKISLNEEVNIVNDELSSPIIAEDFARSIIHLIKNKKNGVYHSAPTINLSRFDFSIKLIDYLGMNSKLIKPVSIKELGRRVTTGKNKCLDSTKLQKSGYKFLTLRESCNILKKQINAEF